MVVALYRRFVLAEICGAVRSDQLRLHRLLFVSAGSAYLAWWVFVHAALPHAFNPFLGRAAVVGVFGIVAAASYRLRSIATHLDLWLALCCCLATAHYFYLFDRNDGDLNWVVGSYITVTAVCAILQSSRSLIVYSLFVAAISASLVFRPSGASYVVFLPGILTMLVLANVGLQSRLRLLSRLHESHERIEALFDAGFDGIAVHEDGAIRQVNDALGPLLGESKGALIGKDLRTLFPLPARELAAEMIAGESQSPFEADIVRKDGTSVTVEVLGKVHIGSGVAIHQVAFRDVTEKKLAEAALVRTNKDLEAFNYSVAHDLRAPLRSIGSFSKVLIEDYGDVLDAEGKRHLDRIVGGAERMAHLVEALLGLARLTRKEIRRETVDLTEHAAAIAEQLRASDGDRIVAFANQPGVKAHGDSQLLHALLDNLLRNAWKFTGRHASPRVAFGCEVAAGIPTFFVRDNGAGFDMAYADKLFAPFHRLHQPKDFPGMGIGLATVHRIVDRHGGRVWAESAIDNGATFYFTLQAGATA
jgi:PAS domain S-box-containing protein